MRLRKQCCGEPGSVLRRGGGGSGVRMMEFAIMRGRWQKKNEDTSTARTGRGPGSAYRAMWVLAIWDGILGHQPARQPEEQPKRQGTHLRMQNAMKCKAWYMSPRSSNIGKSFTNPRLGPLPRGSRARPPLTRNAPRRRTQASVFHTHTHSSVPDPSRVGHPAAEPGKPKFFAKKPTHHES